MSYIAVIHKDKNTVYGASFPEVPGCTAVGDTLDDVLKQAQTSLALYLETLEANERPIPNPKGIEYVMKQSYITGIVLTAVMPAPIE
ncbi:MAG: hypothetical protein GC154_02455 [bacterium]|nr:hypothetical protein [bacterium]